MYEERKKKLEALAYDDALRVIYMWTKTGTICMSEFVLHIEALMSRCP